MPLVFGAAALWGALAPLSLSLAAVVDALRDRRMPRTRAVLFFGLYLGCEVAGVLAAAWLAVRPPARHRRAAFAALQRWWTDALLFGATRIFGMRLHVEGAALADPSPLLLFARHSSAADTVLAAALVANPRKLLLRYVLKRELLWDPCLDLVGQRLPNVFVARTGDRRAAEIDAVARLADGLGPGDGVLIYPEGTRFTPAKLERAREALADRPALRAIADGYRHVLPPRLGGPLALLQTGLDVVFLDQTGFEGSATLASFWRGGLIGTTVAVRLRRIAARDIPQEDLDVWLYEQWRDCDAWIDGWARPEPPREPG